MKRITMLLCAVLAAVATLSSCFPAGPVANGRTVNEEAWRAALVLSDNLTVEYKRVDTEQKDLGLENEYVYRKNVMMRAGDTAYISLPGSGDVFYLSKKAGEHEVTKRFYSMLLDEGGVITVMRDHYSDFTFEDGKYVLRGGLAGAKLDGKEITEISVVIDNGVLTELVCVGKVYNDEFCDVLTVKDIGSTEPPMQ